MHHGGDDEMSADAHGGDADGVDYGDVSDDEPLPMFVLFLRKIMGLN